MREGGYAPVQVVDANLEIDLAAELGGGAFADGDATGCALALIADGVAATGCERVVLEGARRVPGLDVSELARRLAPALAADVSIFVREDAGGDEGGGACDASDGAGVADDGKATSDGKADTCARESVPLTLLARGCAGMSGGLDMGGDFSLRIVYAKNGEARALSHRDTMRELERCVRRAWLPYDVSHGARPHMRTVPGPALPPGCIGRAEPFDVRLCAYVPARRACDALNRVAPAGLAFVSCEYTSLHAAGAAQAFPESVWEARVTGVSPDALQAAFDGLVEQGFLELKKVKQTKAGPVEKTKRVDFAGRLVSAPQVAVAQGGDGVDDASPAADAASAGESMVAGVAVPANAPAGDAAPVGAYSSLRCTWTTHDAGNGALRADLFMAEALSRVPGARLVSITRTALCGETYDEAHDGEHEKA